MSARLLVVAGEASGDRAAAGVVRALRARTEVRVLGMGGQALEAAGMEGTVDLRDTTAMGLGAVMARTGRILVAAAKLVRAARASSADAALLVNYSEFNARLAPILHGLGLRVVWYGAPQVWAWRSGRAASLRPHIDQMAVMLPFEEALWRAHGVDARYVGHPAREVVTPGRTALRESLGLTALARTIAVMPGSRAHEVRALLGPMLEAVTLVRRDRASIDAQVLLAPSLDKNTRGWVESRAEASKVAVVGVGGATGAGAVLPAFDVALTASGTASLEAALARAVPVVAYRVGPVTEAVARLLVKTSDYALPNVLLGRRAFTELVQRDVTGPSLARAVAAALDDRPQLLVACDAVEAALGDARTPSQGVADLLFPWLDGARP